MTSSRHAITLCTLVLLLCCTLATSREAQAGGWTQPAGQCYAKLWGLGLLGGKAAFDLEGDTFDTESFQEIALNHYAECGVADQWTVITSGDAIGTATHNGNSTLFGGMLSLGIRRGILTGPLKLAVEVDYGYQGLFGDKELAPNQTYSYRPTVASHAGRASLGLGYGFGRYWVALDAGVRLFSEDDLSHVWVGGLQVGARFIESLVVDIHLPYNITFDGLSEPNNISGAGNTEYIGLGLGASWWFTPQFAVNAGIDGIVFARANASTPAIQFGVEWAPKLF